MTEQQNFPEVLLISCRSDIINLIKREIDEFLSLEIINFFDEGKIQNASVIILDASILQFYAIVYLQQMWILMREKTVCINLLNNSFEKQLFGKDCQPFSIPFPFPVGILKKLCKNFLTNCNKSLSLEDEKQIISPEEELFFEEFTGKSKLAVQLKTQIVQVAKRSGNILLTGETGTGKSVAARIIHRLSKEKNGPFVHANCANLRGDIARSLIFGTDGGFLTDVQKTDGYLTKANDGILFFDEAECLEPDIQTSLLLTLDDGSYYRVGNSPVLKSSARMIFATNENLDLKLQEGKIRPDFYYRIMDNIIHFPSLRERQEDIEVLAQAFAKHRKKELSKEAVLFLENQKWPGNVRALKKAVERACDVCSSSLIEVQDIEV